MTKNHMNKQWQSKTVFSVEGDYAGSDLVIFGAPFDSTTSFRPGARFGPEAVRSQSYGYEDFSPCQNKELPLELIHDAGDLELPLGDVRMTLEILESYADQLYIDGKIPLMLGGEHLLTLPIVKAAFKQYPDLMLVQFDAHADLRQDYLGVGLSHASVMRRIGDIRGDDRIVSYGVRSSTKEEFELLKAKQGRLFGKPEELLAGLDKSRPLYLTIDLDVLDPSVFPGTGTPEPGGMTYLELQDIILAITEKHRVVGVDLMELAPNYDPSGISTAAACKLLREISIALL